jgi:hypothetical protein
LFAAPVRAAELLPAPVDFGVFNPREVPIELQAWWTPIPDNGKGFGHIHALCKWPIGQTVSGILKTDCRITLHDNPSHNYQLRFDVYDKPGSTVATYEVSHTCPYDGKVMTSCSWTEPVALDTSKWGSGWQRLRVRATVKTVDGKRWTTSSDIVMNVRGAGTATGLSSSCEAGPCFTGKGWYEDNDYQVARINNVPITKVKGTHTFSVSVHKNPARALEVWMDKSHFIPATPSYPAEQPSAGVNLLTVPNPKNKNWYKVNLDTTKMANGWHSLAVRSVGSQPGTTQCSFCAGEAFQTGVAKVYFYVEN